MTGPGLGVMNGPALVVDAFGAPALTAQVLVRPRAQLLLATS